MISGIFRFCHLQSVLIHAALFGALLPLTAHADELDSLVALQGQFREMGGTVVPIADGRGSEYRIPADPRAPLAFAEVLAELRDIHFAIRYKYPDDLHYTSAWAANTAARNMLQDLRFRTSLLKVDERMRISTVLRSFYDAEIDIGSLERSDPEFVDALFRAAELSRARDFLGKIYRRMDAASRPSTVDGLAKFDWYISVQSALAGLDEYRPRSPRARAFVDSLRSSLRLQANSIDPGQMRQFDDPRTMDSGVISASEAGTRVPIGEALIMYHVTDKNVYAFLIMRKQPPRLLILPESPAATRELIRQFNQQISTGPSNRDIVFESNPPRSGGSWRETGARLYRALFLPLEQYLSRVDRLVIVPHDLIHIVPFAALPLPTEGAEQFLVDRYTSVVTPTPMYRAWSSMRRRDWVRMALAVGINDFTLANKLGFAEPEARSIAAFFDDAELLLGSQRSATYKRISQDISRYSIVHIASHGLFIPASPEASNILLQGGGKLADTTLTAADVMGMNLNAKLVVLSACQTATPDARGLPPDGDMLGLPRSFLIAGAERVVASLWSVNDRSTQKFFDYFYTSLYGGRSSGYIERVEFDVALAQAQRKLRRENPDPFYWAPFVLIGSP